MKKTPLKVKEVIKEPEPFDMSFEELVKTQVDLTPKEQAILAIPGAVYNEVGQVAIRYYQTIPRTVTVNKKTYAFVVQHNVCLSWIEPEDVAAVLKIVGGCCGNRTPGAYRLCNALNVKIWRTGDR